MAAIESIWLPNIEEYTVDDVPQFIAEPIQDGDAISHLNVYCNFVVGSSPAHKAIFMQELSLHARGWGAFIACTLLTFFLRLQSSPFNGYLFNYTSDRARDHGFLSLLYSFGLRMVERIPHQCTE